ncbi:MAG: hypothetical protein PHC83_01760 [Bacteroidales bacterium]|nr:hypothetical protein [Bacteroidales bacterium]MDD4208996.1 hypothetical protein [Bacteroidales bacterium]
MKNISFFVLIIFLISTKFVCSQKYSNIFINEINVLKPAFYQVLDTVIFLEKQSPYYLDTLSYGIMLYKSITNNGDSILCFKIEGYPNKEIFIEDDRSGGYLLYKNHYFFVTKGLDLLIEFVSIKKNGIFFKYCFNFSPDEDDRWSSYTFIYYENRFILYSYNKRW